MRRPIARDQNQRRRAVGSPVSSWLNFTPASLSPELWFDASDNSTITESGGFISQWNDKSGNARNLVQATGAAQPALTTNFNGLGTVSFNGSAHFMETASVTITQPMWIYVAFNLPVNPTTEADLIGCISPVVAIRPRWSIGPSALMFAGSTGMTRPVPLGSGKYIWGTFFDGANSSFKINGIVGTGNPGVSGFNGAVRVGRRMDGSQYLNVDIGEVVVTKKRLTFNETKTLETYFNSKWSVF